MSVSKTFKSITIVGLGATLLLTGCSSDDDSPNDDMTTSSPSSSATETEETMTDEPTEESSSDAPAESSSTDDVQAVATVYETYVNSLYEVDEPALREIITAQQEQQQVEPELTDEIAQKNADDLIAAAPDVWEIIDLTDFTVQDRYQYVFMISSIGAYASESGEVMTAVLDDSQITVDGDKASAPVGAIMATVNGETVDTTPPEGVDAPDLEFVKKDGQWLITPIGAENLEAETGF